MALLRFETSIERKEMKDVKNKPPKTVSLSVETVNKCKVSKPAKKQVDFTKRIKAIEKQLKALFVGASGLVTNRQALTFASMWLKVHTDSTNNPPVYDDATAGLAILAANVLHLHAVEKLRWLKRGIFQLSCRCCYRLARII